MAAKHSNTSFVAAARKIHGTAYDYSVVDYKGQLVGVQVGCPSHGLFTVTPKKHLSGSKCPKCAREPFKRTTSQFITEATAVHGNRYNYSQTAYAGTNKPLEIECPNHGKFIQIARVHLNGHGCPKCANVACVTTQEFISEATAIHGNKFSYDRTEVANRKTPVTITCNLHGDFTQTPETHLKSLHGCPTCDAVSRRERATHHAAGILNAAVAGRPTYSYKASSVTGIHSRISVTCDKNHVFWQRIDAVSKSGCPVCAKRHSKGEQELKAFISSLGVGVVTSRKIAAPQEIDAWVPSRNLGFEYNGLYYHSDAFPNAKWRHFTKSEAVRNAGGRLVHIWADDWVYRRNAVEAMIKAQLGLLDRVYARECAVVQLSKGEAKAFLEQWHLQGYAPGTYWGLRTEDGELVASMGFANAPSVRGNNDKGLLELVRFCARARVLGGASKLLAAWKRENAGWHTLITYCDLAQFDGGLYESIGFSKAGVAGPDYKVILAGGDRRVHKSNVRKAALEKLLGAKYDAAKSESQLCAENYIYRVWDCGKAKYEMKRDQ